MSKKNSLVTVLDTDDQVQVTILKSVLGDRNIPCIIKGELLNRNKTLQVQVKETDAAAVLKIIKKFSAQERTVSSRNARAIRSAKNKS